MMIEQTEALDRANRYIEQNRHRVNPKYRDQYHLMAPVGWINDPNGAVYYHGAYHLFYQYYPYASNWGPMHWGHASSKDLVHWEDLPVALAPDQAYDRDGCFSGSAIVHHDRLYLLYTGHVVENGQTFQTQCLAVSDDGIHFVKSRHNPVIAGELLGDHGSIHDFRDPKVFAHDGSFYAVAATKTTDNRGRILLFKSVDLQHWDFFSTLLTGTAEQGIMWECPDFFHLDGYDVLLMSPIQIPRQGLAFRNVSSTMACIGQMDWTTGELTVQTTQEIDYGLDFYAPQTLVDEQGRRIMIAWMQMWNRTMPTHELDHGWAGAMTLPRELRVKEGRLIQKPVSLVYGQLEYLSGSENIDVSTRPVVFRNLVGDNTYMQIVCDLAEAASFTIQFAKTGQQALTLRYVTQTEEFHLSRAGFGYPITGDERQPLNSRAVRVPLVNDQLILEIFRDTSAIEVFINGQETMTATFYEIEKGHDIVFSAEGHAKIGSFETGRVRV